MTSAMVLIHVPGMSMAQLMERSQHIFSNVDEFSRFELTEMTAMHLTQTGDDDETVGSCVIYR